MKKLSLKSSPLVGITLALLICFCPAAPSQGQAQEPKPSVQNLAWLSGCWERTQGKRYVEEYWTKVAGGSMLGVSRTLNDGRTTEFEFLRIHEDKGEVFYTAKPSRQPEASFKLVSLKDREAIFENPAHDFPQRIIYRRTGEALAARIEGELNGQKRGVDFPYTRIKCDAALTN
jgi:hypothetical protein